MSCTFFGSNIPLGCISAFFTDGTTVSRLPSRDLEHFLNVLTIGNAQLIVP
ncbi:MAG: hypothetical protein QXG44_10240 [Candidatus Jordarchaeaceae archaeon]